MKLIFGVLIVLSANFCRSLEVRDLITGNPDSAVIVYKDIANFWEAFDKMNEEGNKVFQKYYINPGSNGVKNFLGMNYGCTSSLQP